MKGIVKGGLNDGVSNIESHQNGSLTFTPTTTTLTISAVVPANSIVKVYPMQGSNTGLTEYVSAEITNATTVTFRHGQAVSVNIMWEVIEYNNVKSKQSGVKSQSALTTSGINAYTVPIASVNTNKSILVSSIDVAVSSEIYYDRYGREITNATTLTFKVYGPVNADINIRWQVIEFN